MLCEIQCNSIILANVYALNIDEHAFFGLLEKKLNGMGDYPIIMGSDFNEVIDPVLDRSSPSARTTRAHAVMFCGYKTHHQGIIHYSPHPIANFI